MASAELIQELIRSHVDQDDERFRRIALQLAAREARAGHRVVAGRIRDLLDEDQRPPTSTELPTPIARPSRDLRSILQVIHPEERLEDLVLEGDASESFKRLLAEQHATAKLAQWSLRPRRKLLLHGPPGCGKTLSSHAIAGELGLPLMRVRVETLFSRYLGETAAVLSAIFDDMASRRAVYLFDEFDAIGKQRNDDAEVGEVKRVVSTFLQLLDADTSTAMVVAATNQRDVLDEALFRRFDDVVAFEFPSIEALERLLELRTTSLGVIGADQRQLARKAEGLSYADVVRALEDAAKTAILEDRGKVLASDIARELANVRRRRHPA